MKESEGLRIVFFGTPEFAAGVLESILKSKHRVVGVVTAPDKPAGRGRKLKSSAVKRMALEFGLPILQPEDLRDPNFLEQLKAWDADVFVIVAFRILPREVWKIPPLGSFNLHASLLPDYRGAAPIHWAIINGEKQTGVTTFFLNDKVDTGDIIAQIPVEIQSDDTAGTLHDKLMKTGAQLTLETLDMLQKGKITTQKQEHLPALHPAPKLTPSNTRIRWDRTVEELDRFIRGLSPFPGAWSYVERNGKTEKWYIYAAQIDKYPPLVAPGTVVLERKRLKIAAANGWIVPLQIKPQSKRTMKTEELINGLKNQIGEMKFI